MDAKHDFALLRGHPDIVSQLSLPRLQKALRAIHESEDPLEALESYLTAFPEFDRFLQKCLEKSRT